MGQFEVQKLRQYAILAPDGHVNENPGFRPGQAGGGRVMGDTTTIWLLELLEVYQHTGELTLIESLWPQVQRAAAWQIASTAEIGLPYTLVCTCVPQIRCQRGHAQPAAALLPPPCALLFLP